MTEISYDLLDASDPDVSYPRSYRENKIFKILKDGKEEELSPEYRYKEVKLFGGWLRYQGISWYIKDKIVQRYAIRGDHLAVFNIVNEDQIIEIYGKPDYKSMSRFGVEYYYFKSKLIIVWSRKKHSLESIMVGDFSFGKESIEHDLKKGIIYINGVRKIRMSSIEQRYTYEGLLEGRPTSKMNDGIIKRTVAEASSSQNSNVYLIEPLRMKPEFKRPYPLGEPENLPAIRCIAKFCSLDPAKDEEGDGSCLTIVWFQDKLAMPIDEGIGEKIELIDWDELATDIYY